MGDPSSIEQTLITMFEAMEYQVQVSDASFVPSIDRTENIVLIIAKEGSTSMFSTPRNTDPATLETIVGWTDSKFQKALESLPE